MPTGLTAPLLNGGDFDDFLLQCLQYFRVVPRSGNRGLKWEDVSIFGDYTDPSPPKPREVLTHYEGEYRRQESEVAEASKVRSVMQKHLDYLGQIQEHGSPHIRELKEFMQDQLEHTLQWDGRAPPPKEDFRSLEEAQEEEDLRYRFDLTNYIRVLKDHIHGFERRIDFANDLKESFGVQLGGVEQARAKVSELKSLLENCQKEHLASTGRNPIP